MSTVIPASDAADVAPAVDAVDPLDDGVEIHRDGPLSGVVGGVAAALAVGYLLRAVGSGSLVDWGLFAATGALAVLHLATLLDARAPLMVIDHHGVRVRRGPHWQGVSWPEVARVEHRPRLSLLRDGSLTVVAVDDRRLGVRLSLSTRLVGADWHELTEALGDLTEGRAEVVEVSRPVRARPVPTDPNESINSVSGPPASGPPASGPPASELPASEPMVAEPLGADEAPEPSREPVAGRRSNILLERTAPAADEPTTIIRLSAAPVEQTSDTSTIFIDADLHDVPDPVVGVVLAEARTRLGLSVDQLADRTRIRPHVIEAIEVDQFEPCGGDFYARGHLRTLARVLGVEAAPLLEAYDEQYADAPIDLRRVFEAELSTGTGAVRGAGGGVNWSVLVAVVMAVVLVWSVTRLVMDGPVRLTDQPVLNGSPGGKAALSGATTTKVPVSLTAVTGGARVIVRDGKQQVVFDEQLAFMQTAKLDVVAPVRISTTDGGLRVSIDGVDKGALGATGQDAQQTFVP